MILLSGLILLLSFVNKASSQSGCLSDAEILSQLIGSAGNLGSRPKPSGDEVLEIFVGIDVSSFNIVPHSSSLELDGIILREWKNSAMYFSHLKPCHNSISLTHLKHDLWTPQVAFVNAIDISLHSHSVKIILKEDGTILHSERVKQSIPCKTQASSYPFGNTTCSLIWRSDDITRDIARIHWKEVKTDGHEAGDLLLQTALASEKEALNQVGVSDELVLDLTFIRGPHKVFLMFYVPAVLFMIIPWLSLLLGPMAITRAIMNMVSLVLLQIHYNMNMAGLPQTNGITSIDIWKIFSFVFIILIICELVIVTLMASLGRSRKCRRGRRKYKGKYELEPLYEEMNDLRERKTRRTCGCCRISALVLDIISFIFFAVLFLAYCIAFYFEQQIVVNFINDFNMSSLKFI